MFFALGDPWMIHFDPRYCLDLPSSTIRLVTTFRFLWHELQSLALVELTGWNMLKQMKLKRVETDEVETWCLFKKLWFASRYRIWRQQNRGSTHIMPTNMKELAKENRGYPWKFKQRDQWEIQTEKNRTIDVRKTKIHRGIDCPKKCGLAKQECRWAANSQLTKKKCGWPSPWFSHQTGWCWWMLIPPRSRTRVFYLSPRDKKWSSPQMSLYILLVSAKCKNVLQCITVPVPLTDWYSPANFFT